MKSFWSPKYLVALIVFSLTSLSIDAGTRMARVVTVRDSRTIVVQSGREQVAITLAGVDPVDRVRSIDFLRWTLGQSWVMLEASTEQPGAYFVYRSPDGLFINREYVLRGFAEPTFPGLAAEPQTPVVYLGEVNPGQRRAIEVASGDRSQRSAAGSKAPARPASPRLPRAPRNRRK